MLHFEEPAISSLLKCLRPVAYYKGAQLAQSSLNDTHTLDIQYLALCKAWGKRFYGMCKQWAIAEDMSQQMRLLRQRQ